jgi:hypothetical protein
MVENLELLQQQQSNSPPPPNLSTNNNKNSSCIKNVQYSSNSNSNFNDLYKLNTTTTAFSCVDLSRYVHD